MRILIYLFPIWLLLGCSGDNSKTNSKKAKGKKDGIVQSRYPDGTIRAEIFYKDGKQHGRAKEFYKDGVLAREIDYVNNIKHGWARRYWESGNLYQETPYDSGKIHGVQKKYNGKGAVTAEATFYQGFECQGLKEYLENGKLKTEYPKINVTSEDRLLSEASYYIKLTMSEKVKKVEYFKGSLKNGCLHNDLLPIMSDGKGRGKIIYNVFPGEIVMENITIIAKVETVDGNIYITHRGYNVAIDFPSPR